MAYPQSYETNADYFDDPGDLIVMDVTAVTLVSGQQYRFTILAADQTTLPKVLPNTFLTYSYPAAGGAVEVLKVELVAGTYLEATRAQEGTTALSPNWSAGATLIQEPTAGLYEKMRALLLATEKFTGLVGSVAAATAVPSPQPGQFYLNSTSGTLSVCFVSGTWVQIDKTDHSAFTGLLAEQAHQIYKTDKVGGYTWHTFQDWHDAISGDHITNAVTHTHDGTYGAPIAKFATGLQSYVKKPDGSVNNKPINIGDVYFAYDTKTLFFAASGLQDWDPYSSLPQGTVLMFDSACPAGWTRVTAFDGYLPKGAMSGAWSGLTAGGSATHQHSLATLLNHTHSMAAAGVSVSSGGSHSHTVKSFSASGGSTVPVTSGNGSSSKTSGDAGSHSHSVSFGGVNSGAFGSAAPKTAVSSSMPLTYTILFCRKS